MTGGSAIARRYARALFSLGVEDGDPAGLLDDLDLFTTTVLESDALRRVLLTPVHPRSERRGVVGALAARLEVSDVVRGLLLLLVEESRTPLLGDVRDELRALVERAAGRVQARITSARPLDAAELEALRGALERRVGASVGLETEVDPNLIGGVVARVGDLLLDGSLRTQLDSLRGSLRKGAA